MNANDSLTRTFGFKANRLAADMRRHLDGVLKPLGLTGQQWKVLHFCVHEGIDIPGDLAQIMNIDGTAVTRLVDRLEKRHLIHRVQNAEDRRSFNLLVSPEGVVLARKASELVEQTSRSLLEGISQNELEATLRTMNTLIAQLEE